MIHACGSSSASATTKAFTLAHWRLLERSSYTTTTTKTTRPAATPRPSVASVHNNYGTDLSPEEDISNAAYQPAVTPPPCYVTEDINYDLQHEGQPDGVANFDPPRSRSPSVKHLQERRVK